MKKEFSGKDYWKTKVSKAESDRTWIRGYNQEEIVKHCSYAEGVFITLKGRMPDKKELRMLDALLCSLLDHEFFSAPIPVARLIISTNPQVIPAIAGALLSCGAYAVSPQDAGEFIEWAYGLMKDKELTKEEAARKIVAQFRSKEKRIPGIGHPLHREMDPRAQSLLMIAEECGFVREKVRLFQAIHHEFVKTSRKKLPINVDGMMACLMSEMGLSPLEMIGINVISHMPGIVAHIVEEMEEGFIGRGLPAALTEYCGKTGLSIEK